MRGRWLHVFQIGPIFMVGNFTTHQPPVPIVFHEHIHSEIARADDLGDVIYLLSVFTAFLNVPVNSVWRSAVVIQGSGIGIYLLFSTFAGSGMDIFMVMGVLWIYVRPREVAAQ